MKKLAPLILIPLLLTLTSCWRAGPIQVVFDNLTPAQQYVVIVDLARAHDEYGFNFTFDNASNKLFVHGQFPANDNYPSDCYVDHAEINGETWRADVYLQPWSDASDIEWGLTTALSY